ncbi:MAG: SLBB domain-containing protein, partial [FCB group bacterium]
MKRLFVLKLWLFFGLIIYLLFPFNMLSQKETYIDYYFITGAKKGAIDTSAFMKAQEVSKQTIGILEKEIDPKSYILGPNDVFTISINASKSIQFDATISPEGKLLMPDIGVVDLKGKSLSDAYVLIKEKVNKVYKIQDIYILLKKIREFKVIVSGAVLKSNVVTATPVDRVSEVIERAGGLRHDASLRKIKIIRNDGREIINVDLVRFYMLSENASNPTVLGGDHIIIPTSNVEERIEIFGEVASPKKFEFIKGDSLSSLIKFAGGFLNSSFLDSLEIDRFVNNSSFVKKWFIDISPWRELMDSSN